MKKLSIIFVIFLLDIIPLRSNTEEVEAIPKERELKPIEDHPGMVWESLSSTISAKSIYKKQIGIMESNGRYDVVNQFGYLGKYQFGKSTLRGLGYSRREIRGFLKNPELQEEAMDLLIRHNTKIILKCRLNTFIGKQINGIQITMEGLLAGSHLVGVGNVKRYLLSGGKIKKRDGNGTSIETYIRKFSDVAKLYKDHVLRGHTSDYSVSA